MLGWRYIDFAGRTRDHIYTTVYRDDQKVVALYQYDAQEHPGISCNRWLPFFVTEHLGISYQRALEFGATSILPPKRLGGTGALSILRDPAGAAFALWTAGTHRGAERTGEEGSVVAFLRVTDELTSVCLFYETLLGWRLRPERDGRHVLARRLPEDAGDVEITVEDDRTGIGEAWVPAFGATAASMARVPRIAGCRVCDHVSFSGRAGLLAIDPLGVPVAFVQTPVRRGGAVPMEHVH